VTHTIEQTHEPRLRDVDGTNVVIRDGTEVVVGADCYLLRIHCGVLDGDAVASGGD
jgi:hypothetical protein